MLSAKALGEEFDLKVSTLGKLLNARRYLGGHESMFFKQGRDVTEAEETKSEPKSKTTADVLDHNKE